MSEDLMTRDGRPTELTLARLEAGELGPEEAARVRAALEADAEARQALEELRVAPIPPSPEVLAAARAHARDTSARGSVVPMRRWLSAGALSLAAAAGLALWVSTEPGPTDDGRAEAPPDGFRTKGTPFAVELWIDDGVSTRRASDGDRVHPGDKLAFRAYPRRDGHLVILCVDPAGVAAICHALGADSDAALAVDARGDALEIAPGLAFDDAKGTERFVGLLCDEPPDLAALVEDPGLTPAGCVRDEVSVVKAEHG